jgi:hypothetical protein
MTMASLVISVIAILIAMVIAWRAFGGRQNRR